MRDIDLARDIELPSADVFDVLVRLCHQPFYTEPSVGVSWSVAVVFRGSVFAVEEFEGRIRLRTSSYAEDTEQTALALTRLLADLVVLVEHPAQVH